MELNVFAGWIGILCAFAAGSVIGLFSHRDDWLGGYTSYRRRNLRLGHIAFAALGMINILFGLTLRVGAPRADWMVWASVVLVVGAFAMPLCCFLAAWKKRLRLLFPIPVVCLIAAVVLLLVNWMR